MSIEVSISAKSSVDIVGSFKPLESGFNYKELGLQIAGNFSMTGRRSIATRPS